MKTIAIVATLLCSSAIWAKTPIHAPSPPLDEASDSPQEVKKSADIKKASEPKKVLNKISDADRNELMMLEASRQVVELKKQVAQLQIQLLECQAPPSEKQIEERKKKLLDLYKLVDGDTVKDDGTIVRKKTER